MIILELIRLEESKYGTFGILKINKGVFCCTLEPPDNENIVNISSIPAQQYICERIHSNKYGDTFQVMDVPERTSVLFHAGNVVEHTKGCIILGQYFGKLRGDDAVLNSGATFKKFMELISGQTKIHLTIKEEY